MTHPTRASHCTCPVCTGRWNQERIDRALVIGLLQATYDLLANRYEPRYTPFTFNQAVNGNTYTQLFQTPNRQRVRLYALAIGNNGGGNVISLIVSGPGQPPVNLATNSGGTTIFSQRMSNNGQSIAGFEAIIPASSTVYLVADGGITVTLSCLLQPMLETAAEVTRGARF